MLEHIGLSECSKCVLGLDASIHFSGSSRKLPFKALDVHGRDRSPRSVAPTSSISATSKSFQAVTYTRSECVNGRNRGRCGPRRDRHCRALRAVDEWCPDVPLLDIGLPGMSGHEVARRLKENPRLRNTALVALTGWGQEKDRLLSGDSGIHQHLTKPIDPDQLERVLARVVKE
ncbi:MAG: response regulator [Acidobacteriota bacterium]